MDLDALNGMWEYYLSLEKDIERTSSFIEPRGQENVYSFEFAKLLILACTEIESAFKVLCKDIYGKELGTIADYKCEILKKYPKIVNATISIGRLGHNIEPFSGWDTGKLTWWDSYQHVKHSRKSSFTEATYINALYALGALYVLIFYIAKHFDLSFPNHKSIYITSKYSYTHIVAAPDNALPDFEESFESFAETGTLKLCTEGYETKL